MLGKFEIIKLMRTALKKMHFALIQIK